MKKDETKRTVSNITISVETYIELKVISIRKQITIQEVISEILNNAMRKKTVREVIPVTQE